MLPPNYSEPPNICTTCGKQWEGNPYEYETDNHEFPCPECAAQQSVQRTCANCGADDWRDAIVPDTLEICNRCGASR